MTTQEKLEALQAALATAREADDFRGEIRIERQIDELLAPRRPGRGVECSTSPAPSWEFLREDASHRFDA